MFGLIALGGLIALLIFMWKLDTDYLTELRKENNMEENNNVVNARNPLFPPYAPEPSYFTQAEAQQLKAFLKVQLNNMEKIRDNCKMHARNKKKENPAVAAAYYKEADKYSEAIERISKIQGKLKHSIQTRG